LQTFHSIGLVVDNSIFFVVFWRLIICCGEFVAKNGIKVCFNVVLGAQVVVIVIIIRGLLCYNFCCRYRVWIINQVVDTL